MLQIIPLTIDQGNIYLKLEREFEEKYQQLCKLETGPESEEYQDLKAELISIDEKIDSLLWG